MLNVVTELAVDHDGEVSNMGMRCSQPQGLPAHAEEFLRDNAVRVNECQHCQRHDGYQREVIGKYGMFDELDLYRYTLLDGSTADEFVQEEMWSSGPMIWLALKWKNTDFRWSSKAVDQEVGESYDLEPA